MSSISRARHHLQSTAGGETDRASDQPEARDRADEAKERSQQNRRHRLAAKCRAIAD